MSHNRVHREGQAAAISVVNTQREVRTGVRTSVAEEFVVTSRDEKVVSTRISPTMRSRDITITSTGFRPNTRYYAFFDGVDVNAHMTPTATAYDVLNAGTPVKGSGLKSDNLGKVNATFSIPNTSELNFTTGQKVFRLTDSASNDKSLSFGEAVYDASGRIRVLQEEITSTRNGKLIREQVTESQHRQATPIEPNFIGYTDPLAQSFEVLEEGGIFISSVELYLAAIDTSSEIVVQIRHMSNGFPTQRIVPFGEKTVFPSDTHTAAEATKYGVTSGANILQTSTDGTTASKFIFDELVYLSSPAEYCFVVWSNSNVYECFISEMGKKDLSTNDFIDTQPTAGSLFKSQNNSTWTPEQMQDLKFKINRAEFTTSGSSNIVFENNALDSDTLENAIETIADTKTFRVKHLNHGNYDEQASVITISGVTGDRTGSVFAFNNDAVTKSSGTYADGTYTDRAVDSTTGSGSGLKCTYVISSNDTTSITITNPGQGYAVGDTVTFTDEATAGGSAQTNSITFTIDVVAETLGGIPIQYINATHYAGTGNSGATDGTARILADIDEYLITIPTTSATADATLWPTRVSTTDTTSNIPNATESVTGGGTAILSSANYYYDIIEPLVSSVTLSNTSITTTIKGVDATQATSGRTNNGYALDSAATTVTNAENNFMSASKIVASATNESKKLGGNKSFNLNFALTSIPPTGKTVSHLSPYIDTGQGGLDGEGRIGATLIQKRINNIDSSSDVSAGTYISSTAPKGDSNACVYMTKRVQLENPANAIHLYFDGYRPPHATTDPEILVYYKTAGPDTNLPFDEESWTAATIKTAVQPDGIDFHEYQYEIEDLGDFTSFAIKLVLQSVDSVNTPMVENFRAIALST